jgi:hypothetical protein
MCKLLLMNKKHMFRNDGVGGSSPFSGTILLEKSNVKLLCKSLISALWFRVTRFCLPFQAQLCGGCLSLGNVKSSKVAMGFVCQSAAIGSFWRVSWQTAFAHCRTYVASPEM